MLDKKYLKDVIDGTGGDYKSKEDWIVPAFTGGQAYTDSDNDGMPNAWEIANGFDPNVDDSAGDADGDGYTNIEEFLNLVDM